MDKIKELENLANGIESNCYTTGTINIFPQDAENLRRAMKTINKYERVLEEIDEECEIMIHYGFKGNDHLWRTRRVIERSLNDDE